MQILQLKAFSTGINDSFHQIEADEDTNSAADFLLLVSSVPNGINFSFSH
jgi:hypothetical protein